MKLRLEKADIRYKDEILSYKEEFLRAGDSMDGTGMLRRSETAEEYLDWCNKFSNPSLCPADKVPSTQYFGMVGDRIVGMIDLRHHIDHPILSQWGGHIGYSVRPSERRKGYAREMFRLVLQEAKAMGMEKMMVTCTDGNIGSEKTILAGGGIYEKTVDAEGELIKRFWITL